MDEQQSSSAKTPEDKQDAVPAAEPQQDELAKAKAEAEEYLSGWKRAMADYANLKKDMERQRDELSKYVLAGFIEKLLPTVDSLNKAVEQQPQLKEGEPVDVNKVTQWISGVGYTRSQIDMVLGAAGITPIKDQDVPFDPSLHEAMMAEKHAKAAPGTVIKVLQTGYKMHDRVLRPAKVVVAE
jgi:molecular chaperone GrpE